MKPKVSEGAAGHATGNMLPAALSHRSVGWLLLAHGSSPRSTSASSSCFQMIIPSIFSEGAVCQLSFCLGVGEGAMQGMGGSLRCLVTNVRGTIVVPCLSLARCYLPHFCGAGVRWLRRCQFINRWSFHQVMLNDIVAKSSDSRNVEAGSWAFLSFDLDV